MTASHTPMSRGRPEPDALAVVSQPLVKESQTEGHSYNCSSDSPSSRRLFTLPLRPPSYAAPRAPPSHGWLRLALWPSLAVAAVDETVAG
jgi:hypothetical protein